MRHQLLCRAWQRFQIAHADRKPTRRPRIANPHRLDRHHPRATLRRCFRDDRDTDAGGDQSAHGIEVAQKISTGMVYINHPTGVAADLPFGGVRRSGYGRELVGFGIKEFVNHKLIAVTDIDGAF